MALITHGTDVDGESSNPKDTVLFITDYIKRLAEKRSESKPNCTMFAVQPHLRNLKPEHYTPREVSLGLFNRNPMNAPQTRGDKLRLEVAYKFLDVMSNDDDINSRNYYSEWLELCERVVPELMASEMQNLYDETGRDPLSPHEEQTVLTLDAIFLTCFLGHSDPEFKKEHPTLQGPLALITKTTKSCILDDILKLENQIPLQLIQIVMRILFEDEKQADDLLHRICLRVTWYLERRLPGAPNRSVLTSFNFLECDSLLDCGYRWLSREPAPERNKKENLLKCGYRWLSRKLAPVCNKKKSLLQCGYLWLSRKLAPACNKKHNLLNCGYRWLSRDSVLNTKEEPDPDLPSTTRPSVTRQEAARDLPSVTRLQQAGIEFRGIEGGFRNVLFERVGWWKAILYLPTITIEDTTEPLWRNLLAFEQMQCNDALGKHATEYYQFGSFVDFMDNLIDDDNDVKLLTKGNPPVIRQNMLGSYAAVARLFNNELHQNCITPYPWISLKKEIFNYYNSIPRRTCVEFLRKEFGKPWLIVSLIAAIILLIATLLQTVYTFLGYYY